MSLLIELLLYAGIAAGIGLAFHEFEQTHYVKPAELRGASEQRTKDEPILAASQKAQKQAEDDRDTARANSTKCEATLKVSSDAAAEWSAAALKADAAAKVSKAQAAKDATEAAPRIAQLQKDAAAKPQLLSCQAELAKADKVLTDSLKQRGHK